MLVPFLSLFLSECTRPVIGVLETTILHVLSKWLRNNIWYSDIVINGKTNSHVQSCQRTSALTYSS